MSIIELFIVVLWFAYGISFGFNNLSVEVKAYMQGEKSYQGESGKFFDALFTVSFVAYVLVKSGVIDVKL